MSVEYNLAQEQNRRTICFSRPATRHKVQRVRMPNPREAAVELVFGGGGRWQMSAVERIVEWLRQHPELVYHVSGGTVTVEPPIAEGFSVSLAEGGR